MDPVALALISKALDGLTMRSEAIAQNIANANTPNYHPITISFEDALREASDEGLEAIHQVEPELLRELEQLSGDGTRLDLEMARSSETALRYSALVDVLSRQLQIQNALVRGGQQ